MLLVSAEHDTPMIARVMPGAADRPAKRRTAIADAISAAGFFALALSPGSYSPASAGICLKRGPAFRRSGIGVP